MREHKQLWVILALIAAVTLPSAVAAVILPSAEAAYAQGETKTPPKGKKGGPPDVPPGCLVEEGNPPPTVCPEL